MLQPLERYCLMDPLWLGSIDWLVLLLCTFSFYFLSWFCDINIIELFTLKSYTKSFEYFEYFRETGSIIQPLKLFWNGRDKSQLSHMNNKSDRS